MSSQPKPASEAVLQQLDRVLQSPPFRSSKRCSDFLRFVVEGACEGRAELLKERTLGVSVFDRKPDYDTTEDPVVRNTAGQVRKRLAQYYCEPGRDREIRIDLPAGAYIPEIQSPAAAPVPEAPPSAKRTRRWAFSAAAVCFVVLAVGIAAIWPRAGHSALDRFWAPVVHSPGAVVLCVGQGHTYKLRAGLDRLFETGSEGPPRPADSKLPLSDIVPAWDRYVGLRDAQTLTNLTVLFTRYGRDITLRGGRATSLADLRGKPSVLVGAFNNDWTLSLTGELRFYFAEDRARNTYLVRDRRHPDNRAWEVSMETPPEQIPMDYAIVSRVFSAATEQPVVVVAGITGAGTTAAGELLTRPAYLEQALAPSPRDWDRKNIQLVVETRLFAGNPAPPKVIASWFW